MSVKIQRNEKENEEEAEKTTAFRVIGEQQDVQIST
jgi:hypothetical protein